MVGDEHGSSVGGGCDGKESSVATVADAELTAQLLGCDSKVAGGNADSGVVVFEAFDVF